MTLGNKKGERLLVMEKFSRYEYIITRANN